MKTFEITCTAIAVVKVTVPAEDQGAAEVDLSALPSSVQIGGSTVVFENWIPESVAAVSA